jgi:hypothetical protein
MTLEERERHIAAARESHPIQLNAPVKPRLSYVLSEQAAPVTKPEKEGSADRHDEGPPSSLTE